MPEEVLHILRKLQHHHPLDAEGAPLDVVVVDLVHDLLAELFVRGLGQAGEVVPLDLLHCWLSCLRFTKFRFWSPGLQVLVKIRPMRVINMGFI
jgi:hypothetical protein